MGRHRVFWDSRESAMWGVFSQCTPDFNRGPLWGVSRCLKANMNDAAVLIEFEYETGEI